jgi:EAL domain-containing protein (putative c-di-GMP-specific phosphodiesterase class I)
VVERLPWDRRAAVVVQALLEISHEVGARVAATGVTTPDELAAVRGAGIGWAQGPLFGERRGTRRCWRSPARSAGPATRTARPGR